MFTKENPFYGKIIERRSVSSKDSEKQTFHVSVDISGSDISYKVGDSFGFIPKNNPEEVEKIIKILGCSGEEIVEDKKGNRGSLRHLLTEKCNIADVTRGLASLVSNDKIARIIDEREALKGYLGPFHVWDFLETHGKVSVEELVMNLQPLLPRFYSVASSQQVDPHRVDFLVADVEYETNGIKRHGVGSRELCHSLELHEKNVPLFLQPAHAFSLTEEKEKPIIMIGPGTGVAPFRGFMQERVKTSASKKNWLFFGERRRLENFYYQEEWEVLEKEGSLRLSLAFSRDQHHKIYVQEKMMEEADLLYEWINEGAYIYVCGDAHRMAKSVEAALLEIIETRGGLTSSEAKETLKLLRKSKRYQRDVY